jgi:hypothetical protein
MQGNRADNRLKRYKGQSYKFLAIRLCASVDEERALLNKVLGEVEKLLDLVAHLDGQCFFV